MPFTQDRLGSGAKTYPYGEEKTPNGQDGMKFYSSQWGRFMNPDPYVASGGPADPGSWNQYTYTRGDPTNHVDPAGTCDEPTTYDSIDGVLQVNGSIPCASLPYNYGNPAGPFMSQVPSWQAAQDVRESGFCVTQDGRSCEEVDRERREQEEQSRAVEQALQTAGDCLLDSVKDHLGLTVAGTA